MTVNALTELLEFYDSWKKGEIEGATLPAEQDVKVIDASLKTFDAMVRVTLSEMKVRAYSERSPEKAALFKAEQGVRIKDMDEFLNETDEAFGV